MSNSLEAIKNVKGEEMLTLAERLVSLLRGVVGQKAEAHVAEEPVSVESVSNDGKAESKGEKPSQSELVRQCMKSHGKSRNKEIIDIIKRDHGVEVAPSLVSYIRSKEFHRKAPEGRKAAPPKATVKKTERIVSHSSLVRAYLERHSEASNDEVVKEIARSNKVQVKPTLVSSVRAIIKRKGTKTARIASKPAPKNAKKDRKGLPMPALVVRVLEKAPREGMKLREMTDKVIAAGYEYQGTKGWEGIAQNVYQAVHALSKTVTHAGYEGKTAVVLHDSASKRWKLNPRAIKKKVA